MLKAALIALFASTALGFASPARACSCGFADAAARDAAIGLIVTARVIAISPPDKYGDRYADFESIDIERGPQQTSFRVHYYQGDGANCGAAFTLGETITVYARRAGNTYSTNYCLLPGTSVGELADRYRVLEDAAHAAQKSRAAKGPPCAAR
jgi:hypothetical protein